MYSTLQGPYMFPRRTVLLHEAHSHSKELAHSHPISASRQSHLPSSFLLH